MEQATGNATAKPFRDLRNVPLGYSEPQDKAGDWEWLGRVQAKERRQPSPDEGFRSAHNKRGEVKESARCDWQSLLWVSYG
jgi:hypothetical protein